MAALAGGHKAIEPLLAALGLDGKCVKRVVLVVDVEEVVQAHVMLWGDTEIVQKTADLLAQNEVGVRVR